MGSTYIFSIDDEKDDGEDDEDEEVPVMGDEFAETFLQVGLYVYVGNPMFGNMIDTTLYTYRLEGFTSVPSLTQLVMMMRMLMCLWKMPY